MIIQLLLEGCSIHLLKDSFTHGYGDADGYREGYGASFGSRSGGVYLMFDRYVWIGSGRGDGDGDGDGFGYGRGDGESEGFGKDPKLRKLKLDYERNNLTYIVSY